MGNRKGGRLSEAQRAVIEPEVWRLHLRRVPVHEIAKRCDINKNTVDKYVQETRVRLQEIRDEQEMADLEEFLAVENAIESEGWKCVDDLNSHQMNKPSLLSVIGQSNERKAKALGLFTNKVEHSGELNLAEIVASVSKPVEVVYHEEDRPREAG